MSLPGAGSAQQTEAPYLAIFAACLLILLALIDSQVVAAITPLIATGLATSNTTVASSVAIYSVAAATVALGLGKYSHRIRSDRWLPIAAGLFFIANIIAATAPHVIIFFAARAITGFAGGLISALTIAGLANASSYAKRGKQMSVVAICYFLAPVLGVPLGTLLTGNYGWRTLFYLSSSLVALAGLLVYLYPLPISENKSDGETVPTQSLRELATRSKSTRMGIIGAFFVSGGLVGFTTYLGSWLSDAFQAGPRQVGSIYALAGFVAVLGGALGGILADRFGKRLISMQSSIAMALFLVLLPTFTWSTTLFVLVGFTSFFAALRVAPLQALITELVEPGERATYIALRNGASQFGIAVAVSVSARLYPSYGLAGIGILCAALSIGAWYCISVLHDPQAQLKFNVKMAVSKGSLIGRRIMVVGLTLMLLIFGALPWLMSFLITKAHTRPNERVMTETPANRGAIFENVTFSSLDGKKLSGWYLPAHPIHSNENITIVMTHGLFRSRYEMFDRGVDLWKQGYGVLLYDLRRHGQSGGEFSTIGYNERYDVKAAADFVRGQAPGNKIVLMGVSMGAAATLMAAAESAESKDIIGVIAESSFLSFSDTVHHHMKLFKIPEFPFANLLIWITAWRVDFNPADFDIIKAVKKINCPILFIGGSADARMPTETVLEPLYRAANNPLKNKLIVEGAQHGKAYETAPVAYKKAVIDFLEAIAANQVSKQ